MFQTSRRHNAPEADAEYAIILLLADPCQRRRPGNALARMHLASQCNSPARPWEATNMTRNRWILPTLMLTLLAGPLTAGLGQATPTIAPAPLTCGELAARVAQLEREELRVDCDGDDAAINPHWEQHYLLMANAEGPHTLLCTGTNECAVYVQPIGTMACDPIEWLLDDDTDGDGEKDCSDADDDGDMITDEAEHWAYRTQATRARTDYDGDGFHDPDEFTPLSKVDVKIDVFMRYYDHDNARCDGGTDWADPYLSTFALKLVPGGHMALPIPVGWARDTQVNDRSPGKLSDVIPTQKFSPRVSAWSPAFWEIPRIAILPIMFDRDVFDYDDPVDIFPGGGASGELAQKLTVDSEEALTFTGDSTCRAKLTLGLMDNVNERIAKVGVAHWSSPSETLTLGRIQGGSYR